MSPFCLVWGNLVAFCSVWGNLVAMSPFCLMWGNLVVYDGSLSRVSKWWQCGNNHDGKHVYPCSPSHRTCLNAILNWCVCLTRTANASAMACPWFQHESAGVGCGWKRYADYDHVVLSTIIYFLIYLVLFGFFEDNIPAAIAQQLQGDVPKRGFWFFALEV